MQRVMLAMAMGVFLVGCDEDGVRVGAPPPTPDTGAGTGNTNTNPFPTEVTYSDPVGSCDLISLDGSCVYYLGANWGGGVAEASCTGTFSDFECPPNPIGYCAVGGGGDDALIRSYYEGAYYDSGDATGLQTSCEASGGSWSG